MLLVTPPGWGAKSYTGGRWEKKNWGRQDFGFPKNCLIILSIFTDKFVVLVYIIMALVYTSNNQVHEEIERRKKLGRDSQRRRKIIATKYKPIHPHVYTLQVSVLS